MDTSQGHMIGGLGCTTFPGNMSRKQERPKVFGSTDTSASGEVWFFLISSSKFQAIFGTS